MDLLVPTVGPILGHTTPEQVHIFLRGDIEKVAGGARRCFAAVRHRAAADTEWAAPIYNKLSANFDMTAVIVLQGLEADTDYFYQAAWFFSDLELDEVRRTPPETLRWPGKPLSLRTGSADPRAQRSYIIGSCRYMLRLFDANFFDDRGDKPFRSINQQLYSQPTHGLVMMGDQIYADDLNLVLPDTTLEKYLKRYRAAFGQPHIREAMSQLPSYMILDDHEIEDNWPAKAKEKDRVTLFPNAMHAYQIYQCSHSPLFKTTQDGRIDGNLQHYWYTFSDGCAEWFVMDTRTQRQLTGERRMIDEPQLQALLDWLGNGSGKVKLVVSSVMVFPDLRNDTRDTWKSFPDQRLAIFERVRQLGLKRLAFLSGDVHCSMASRLSCNEDPDFSILSIVSSPFFWPLPHTGAGAFQLDQKLAEQGTRIYSSSQLTPVHADDNFARLTVDPQGLQLSYFDCKGSPLGGELRLEW